MQLPRHDTINFADRSKKTKQSRRVQYLPAWILLAVIAWMLFPNFVAGSVRIVSKIAVDTVPSVVVDTANIVGDGAELAYDGGSAVGGVVVDGVAIAANAIADVPVIVGGLFASSAPEGDSTIAPLFTQSVNYWEADIARWSQAYNLDPNLLATVMQIESCGHPTVSSHAGAQGLFQVMPFHFSREEDQLDPDTNAMRGANFLNQCLRYANGDVGLALACYNGGPSVVTRSPALWDQQVRDYYQWGTGIYADTLTNQSRSETLDRWLAAGGDRLCRSAALTLGIE